MTDVALVVGILINVVKGGDLLLRQHQKDWLQNNFETLTLRLEYIRPIAWFGALSRPLPAAIWSVASAAFAFAAPMRARGEALVILWALWLDATGSLFLRDSSRLPLAASLLVAIPISVVCLWKVCPPVVRKLVGNGHVRPFFGKLLVLYASSVAIHVVHVCASDAASGILVAEVLLAVLWLLLLPIQVLNTAGLLLVSNVTASLRPQDRLDSSPSNMLANCGVQPRCICSDIAACYNGSGNLQNRRGRRVGCGGMSVPPHRPTTPFAVAGCELPV